jgi:putative membrane protein
VTQTSATPARRRWLRYGALAAVVLVPLAFAGLFVGAVSQLNHGINSIPAAIVNNDQVVTTKAADGSTSNVLAGRELVTQLTGKKSAGFSWTITNSKTAKEDLANGTVYAILTVPKDFSKSIVSLSSQSPKRADLGITTDDSHNYLTGSVAQVVGDSLTSAFGKAITQQYISGLYSSVGSFGGSLSSAADGAGQLSSGAGTLSSGLSSLAGGVSSAQSGASSLASGLRTLSSGTSKYTQSVTQLSAALSQASTALAADPTNPTLIGTVQAISANLAKLSASGSQLTGGVQKSATGASSLATGLSQLSTGASSSATGAQSLATGAGTLESGLRSGASQVPSYSAAQSKKAAGIVSSPIGVHVTRENEVSSPGQIIATLFVPLGLWIGSLAVFLVMRPISRRTLSSTVGNGRLVLSSIGRASIITAAQALLLVGLLHVAVGVSWSLLPATILFSLVMALAFTAFHYLLTIGLGRAGLVVSIFLLAIQITSTGGLYPIQLLAGPFQFISPFLPLTYGVQGMQAIIANSGAGSAIGAALALAAFGVGSVLIAMLAVRRVRRAKALGLVPSIA